MMMLALDLERLSQSTVGASQSLKVRSALNPLLWLCGITTPTMLVASYLFLNHAWLAEFLAISAAMIPLLAVGAYWYLALKKPEQLRSEDFQLRQQALQIYSEKIGEVKVLPMSVEHILIPPSGGTGHYEVPRS